MSIVSDLDPAMMVKRQTSYCPDCNPASVRRDSGTLGAFLTRTPLPQTTPMPDPNLDFPSAPCPNPDCPFRPSQVSTDREPITSSPPPTQPMTHPVHRAPRTHRPWSIPTRPPPAYLPPPTPSAPGSPSAASTHTVPHPAYSDINPFCQRPITHVTFRDPNNLYAKHQIDIVFQSAHFYWLDIRDPARPDERIDMVVPRREIVVTDEQKAEWSRGTWSDQLWNMFCQPRFT